MSHLPADNRFAILLDGPIAVTERLLGQMKGRRVIAADGGIRHAKPLGLTPELWVGDFDSASDEHVDGYAAIPRESHPMDKASSDGNLATARALALGATDILFCGATGGERTDHVLFNLSAMVALAERHEFTAFASDGLQECYPLAGPTQIRPDVPEGSIVSIFGFSDIEGLTVTGAKWPLENTIAEFGNSLTLSNVVHRGFRVRLQSGRAVAIIQIGSGLAA